METISIRDLRNRPGGEQEALIRKGEVLLTSNGRPVAVMLPVDGATLGETLRVVRLARGQLALRALRRQAREGGVDDLSAADVAQETKAVRKRKAQG